MIWHDTITLLYDHNSFIHWWIVGKYLPKTCLTKGLVVLYKKVSKWLYWISNSHYISFSERRQNYSVCWIQVLCDKCPFYNFQIPHSLLIYQVAVRKVTEEINVDATMTSPQSLYRLINLTWIDSSGVNISDWNLKYVLFGFPVYIWT